MLDTVSGSCSDYVKRRLIRQTPKDIIFSYGPCVTAAMPNDVCSHIGH